MAAAFTSFQTRFHGAAAAPWETRFRQAARTAGFGAYVLLAAVELAWLSLRGQTGDPMIRALWLRRICRRLERLLDMETRHLGKPAARGLFVFNHVSYLDIIALAARRPLIFVAKQEVRSWPVIGWLAAAAGTVFIDRHRRGDVAAVSKRISDLLARGMRVCIFPEGTSSDGSRVLPFRTSLLEPAMNGKQPVTVGWIGYSLDDGAAETEACYWGDLSFGPHLLNLFAKRQIHATVAYATVGATTERRKEFGQRLHALVCSLAKYKA
jgi:1-acyl-sn-glycerol-3-phosphate acyltransferase